MNNPKDLQPDEVLGIAIKKIKESGGGGGGTSDYNDLNNLPTMNGTEIKGALSAKVTPAGNVSASVSSTTGTVNSIESIGTLPKYEVSGKKLTVTLGTLPKKGEDTTVVTAVGNISASFTGSESNVVLT